MAMSDEKIVAALMDAQAAIRGKMGGLGPTRFSEPMMEMPFSQLALSEVLCHLLFMCEEAERMLADGRREKVMRWLGWVQGSLWALGITTIADAKNANRPEEPKIVVVGGEPKTPPLGMNRYGSFVDDGHGGDDMHRGASSNRSGSNFEDGYEEGTFDK